MSTPLPFEKMYEDANTWTREVAAELGHENAQAGYHALRGVLFALRDRMPAGEVFDLAAQLPTLLRGVYFEGYDPSGKPEKGGLERFLERVSGELQTVNGESPERAAKAVFSVIASHISQGEVEEVKGVMPEDVRQLLT